MMTKTVTFKCAKCGKNHVFNIGTRGIATLSDAVECMPVRDADKLLESVNRMLMNKSEAQRTSFMMNNADAMSMINYDVCGQSINMFEAEDIKATPFPASPFKYLRYAGRRESVAFGI